ncbi:hypothetical protein E0I26_11865 [Flavobacterium rhamnosiphilum]|uniref:Uncharacterized protein n=1 Tax=Flavobacterium rhamnosiphilum TaxID=2541724 RepID=A0A4R5F5A5_9FLAO|nr:hypothetical protein [Flavobacterium rhamnosiphilum]TDE42868.1 hypothetical protein E0I26_11865 [Flavobacterium rhamnosiphilum]
MEKHNFKNSKLLILILIISNLLYSQNETIVPKNGAIVFIKKEIITDTLLYKKSFDKSFYKMLLEAKKEVLMERGNKISQIPDSINQQLNQMFEMMKSIAMQEIISNKPKSLIKYHHTYNNYEIEEFISVNDKYLNKKKITNSTDFQNDDLLAITGIEEYKNETKTIKGLKCFRVVMYYFDLEMPSGFKSLLNIMELWVTEDIKSKFHPFIKSNEILEKYFPLQVKHTIKDVEGMYTSYEILDFSLK